MGRSNLDFLVNIFEKRSFWCFQWYAHFFSYSPEHNKLIQGSCVVKKNIRISRSYFYAIFCNQKPALTIFFVIKGRNRACLLCRHFKSSQKLFNFWRKLIKYLYPDVVDKLGSKVLFIYALSPFVSIFNLLHLLTIEKKVCKRL